MKLYLLKSLEGFEYDEYDSFVVRARGEGDARNLANGCEPGSNGRWLSDERSSCVVINGKGERGMVIGSFNAG